MVKHPDIALMNAIPLPEVEGGVPEWVHVLPRPGRIETHRGDGPYSYASASELIAASMGRKQRVIVDVNHSTFTAGAKGGEAPARGYVTAMEERDDGIWARIDWTESGRVLMADRAYWGISPAFKHARDGRILAILNVSLTNEPNLRGLTALNTETEMSLAERLAKTLGLGADATDDQIADAVSTLNQGGDDTSTALQSQLSQVGVALGLDAESDGEAVLAAAKKAAEADGGDDKAVVALQAELSALATKYNTLTEGISRERAEAFVDAAIQEGRVGGLSVRRDAYIAMHMEKPEETEALVNAMPILGPSGTLATPPKAEDGKIALQSEHVQAARLLGIDPEEYAKQLEAEGKKKEAY